MKKINYVVLMDDDSSNKYVMKWGKCETLEDVQDFKDIYLSNYPNAKFEVFEVKN